MGKLKLIGYTRGPFHVTDNTLAELRVYTKEDLNRLKRYEIFDWNYHVTLSPLLDAWSYMVDYKVLQDASGNRVYRPVSLYQRAKRALFQRLNKVNPTKQRV